MIKTTVPVTVVMRDGRYADAVMRGLAIAWRELRVRCEIAESGEEERIGEGPACVLTDPETFAEASRRYRTRPLFVIGDPFETERENVTFISPFAGAREIGAMILGALGRERCFAGEGDVFGIAVTSAAGGVGLSSIASAVSRMIRSLRDGPVLALSYEPYPAGWRLFRAADNGRTIEDYLFRRLSPFGTALPEAFLREDVSGVRFFASNGNRNELIDFGEEEGNAFLGSVLGAFRGGTAVFDVPSPDLRGAGCVFGVAHVLVIVGDGSAETEARNGALEERILERFAFRRVLRVVNETRPGRPFGAVIREGDFVLPYDPASIEADGICLEKAFGSGVRELAEELERIRRGEEDARTDGDGRADAAYRGVRAAADAGYGRLAVR